ncbi:GGDEF domain-containing protein [Oceanobacter mangrovi]|uniref:GGDEF domain-containing protein n=1 Tax=Oceanobacter mangrovi TaxID=2862510 RepID=UPI001C8DC2B0|nr:GGDEF domain-containing protein [Oceanobacter mangrovi]
MSMFTNLGLHRQKLVLIFGLALSGLVGFLLVGTPKTLAEIDWLDVVGEGGSALALAVWMMLIIGSRPAGRVTDLLTLGLGFMFLAMWQDNLDEFIRLPGEVFWDHWLESGAMPIGVALLTYGLVHWHKEQLSINQQLRKRERLFREHRFVDNLTQLGRVGYLREQLQAVFGPQQQLVLLMVDIDNFADVNRLHGHREGDAMLHEISELLLLNLRQNDLVCRYAADRFAVLLPDTDSDRGRQLGEELAGAVKHFAYKHKTTGESLYQTVSIGLASWQGETAEQLIQRANLALQQAKSSNGFAEAA